MNLDMLRLSAFTLERAGGEVEPFLARIKELEERWEALETEIAHLQQELYDSMQRVWKEQRNGQH